MSVVRPRPFASSSTRPTSRPGRSGRRSRPGCSRPHPGDSSYAKAAELLRRRDFVVEPLTEGRLSPEVLAGVSVLVLPHGSDPQVRGDDRGWLARYDDTEVAAIRSFVESGGGLVILAESEQDKYGSNLADIAAGFGITIEHTTVQDYQRHHQAPSWVESELATAHPLLSDVDDADLLPIRNAQPRRRWRRSGPLEQRGGTGVRTAARRHDLRRRSGRRRG